jgi:hypothetical protein
MNIAPLPRRLLLALSLVGGAFSLSAQANPNVTAPNLREKVVADALRVAQARDTDAPPAPASVPNPFVPRPVEAPASAEQPEIPTGPALGGADLLARIAARIPATGTVSIGGEPILLLGQKRLKVGEQFTISFEGQTHEVTIAAVTATTFTVRRGEHIHTRPVHIAATSTNTPNRP